MFSQSLHLALIALAALAEAAPNPIIDPLSSLSNYAPVSASCPSFDLVRPATSLNSNEAEYISRRRPKANAGLSSWLQKLGKFNTKSLPSVGFASSGGGLRALLCTAGVIKALDGRDTDYGTSGLYQGLTYESALSGGAWFQSSLASNNWPTVSSLQKNLWVPGFADSLLLPANLLSLGAATEYADVVNDVMAKAAAGYQVSVVDVYGRILSYSLLYGNDAGVTDRLSGLRSLSNFTEANVPFPIMTALGNMVAEGQCFPALNATQYEFTTYEYGSWDAGVSAFANSKYMGTSLSNGKPTGKCTTNYDNIGYVFGTSSDVFNSACPSLLVPSNSSSDLAEVFEAIIALIHDPTIDDEFALYPNPFYKYPRSTLVSDLNLLTLADGGEADQNIPIWPFIAGARTVDVLITSDNSADTTENYPNGTEIHQTYVNAVADGHTRMPFIPDVATFISEGLNKRATFFGCNETAEKMFIVYLPNVNYTYPSGESTFMVEYSKAQTDGVIANGVAIATQNGDKEWPFCLACGIMSKQEDLPEGCEACLTKYCYTQ